MKDWLIRFYGEHKWLSILAVAALVLGILFLCIGFWRTLLLAAWWPSACCWAPCSIGAAGLRSRISSSAYFIKGKGWIWIIPWRVRSR